ncbi:MAG TPA: hypothetical protein VGI19_00430 [Candidatus Cybelea sp.]
MAARGGSGAPHYQYPKGVRGSLELLKLQADGKIPSPITRAAAKWEYKHAAGTPRPNFHHRRSGDAISIWAANENFSYLVGMNRKLKDINAIDTSANGCYNPVTVKVDHNRNVWAGCQFNSTFNAGAAQEYDSNGNLTNTYNVACPTNIPASQCVNLFSEGFDSAVNAKHVFANLVYYDACDLSYNCQPGQSGGFEYWKAGSPSSQPTLISTSLPGMTVYGTGYFDVDANDNIYFWYDGCENAYPYTCGYGLAEIESATGSSPTQIVLTQPNASAFWGGVSVSKQGTVLNVLEQNARTVTQYALPWTGSPIGSLGPTQIPAIGVADPISGGFDRSDSKIIIGDGYGWLDGINAKTNAAKVRSTAVCADGCGGAAFTPSDK